MIASKTLRSVLSVVILAGACAALNGCTDDEIAASALVIGAAAIAGGGNVEVREEHWHRGPRRWHDMSATVASSALDAKIAPAASSFVSKDARVIALADKYDVSDYAATYLVRAIVLAQAKDASGVKDLGLSVGDFKDLYDGKEMASAKIDVLASKLKMDSASTSRLVSEMAADVQTEKAARGL